MSILRCIDCEINEWSEGHIFFKSTFNRIDLKSRFYNKLVNYWKLVIETRVWISETVVRTETIKIWFQHNQFRLFKLK